VKATINALKSVYDAKTEAGKRGITVSELFTI